MAILTASWILDFFLLLITAIGSLYAFYWKQFKFWAKLNVPHTDPSFIVGDTGEILRTKSMGEVFKEIYNSSKGEKYIGFWSLFRPMLLVRDPELIKRVFVKDFSSFQDRGIYVNEKDDPLSAHLFSMGGPKWKFLRNKLSPTFTSGKMKMMFPTVVARAKELDNILNEAASKNEILEVKDLSARFTTDVIASCAFGLEANCLKNPDAEFRQIGRKALEPAIGNMGKQAMAFFAPAIAEMVKLKTTPKEVSQFFLKAIKDTMDYREKNGIKRNDFLQLVLELKNKGKLSETDETANGEAKDKDKDNTKITFEEAAAQVYVFYLGGFETSSTTLQFILYELAINPELQSKTRYEINQVLAKNKNELTYETISEMSYVGRVIDETLRKYPIIPFLQRECNRDYQIPDTKIVIPKGTLLMMSPLGMHHDPQYFPQPERFDPDRFTEEEKSKRHHYSYLPFGEGPRNCIGMRFGLMQTRVALVTFLSKYKFDVCEGTPIPMVLDPKSLPLSPKGGMYLKISKV